MKREIGNKQFSVWLLGDSEPKNWKNDIDTPLDPKHPIRHNIWTSVLEIIQDKIFRTVRKRVDTSLIFIRNAVGDPIYKPSPNEIIWDKSDVLLKEIKDFKNMVYQHTPKIIFCFGAFSFEFGRRTLGQKPERNYGYWGARQLGEEFCRRINRFNINDVNILPMLHRSIAGGKFLQSHKYFCNQEKTNYFDFVGAKIADKILEYQDKLEIWI